MECGADVRLRERMRANLRLEHCECSNQHLEKSTNSLNSLSSNPFRLCKTIFWVKVVFKALPPCQTNLYCAHSGNGSWDPSEECGDISKLVVSGQTTSLSFNTTIFSFHMIWHHQLGN